MGTPAPYHQAEFTFVFYFLRLRRQNNGFAGSDDCGRRLKEDQRFLRHFIAELRGVRRIIAADANDLARCYRSQELYLGRKPRSAQL